MEKNKKNRGVITLLLVIIIVLTVLCVLFATDTIKLSGNTSEDTEEKTNLNGNTNDTNEISNQETTCEPCTCQDTSKCDDSINFDELGKIKKLDHNYVNYDRVDSNTVAVLDSGKVIINWKNYISNISNAKDVKMFVGPGDAKIYILTKDGSIYEYSYDKLNDANNTNFEATKINEYSNIKQMIAYHTGKANAGGCSYLVLIDNNNKYYTLNSYCV